MIKYKSISALETLSNEETHCKLANSAILKFSLTKLSNVFLQTAFCLHHDCSDCKIMKLMASLCFGPRLLWKKQSTLILIVCCTAWVGGKYIGEVISPFRTLPRQKMAAQLPFFRVYPQQKADFVLKKKADRTWGISWLNCVSGSQKYKSLH